MLPTVFIVDGDPATRALHSLLAESIGLASETFTSAVSFLDRYDPDRPGCLICDRHLPGMSGLELQERLRAIGSPLPIIMVTSDGDGDAAVRAMMADAADFLEKPVAKDVLLGCIRRAIERDAAGRAARDARQRIAQRLALLTRREREVMTCVVEGLSSRQIALRLGVNVKTVEAHRIKIMRKMQAGGVAQLIRMYFSL